MTDRREREAQLRRERDLTDRLLETVPVRLAIFEPDGSLDRINERARRKIGLEETPSSEFRLEDLDVTDADGRPMPTVEHPVSTVIETEEPVSDRVVQHEDPEGNTHWLTLNAAPLFDETGTLERVVVAGKDITTERRARRQVERQREDLKTELDEIFDRIDDGFLAIDDDWICTHINEQAAAMLGRSAGDLVGQNIWEEFPEATEYSFRQQYERALQTQESVSFEEYYDPLDTWYELTAYPSKTGLSVYFRDITERKERERELEQYRAIVETVEDGIYAVDSDNRFRLVNDAFCDLTGHDRAELLGAHVTEVYDENGGFVSSSPAPGVTPDQQEVTNIELEVETQSGESIPCETRLVPISLDEEQGWCGVIRDVTDHREFQETLTALYDSACKLLAADSTAEVSDVVVETATDVLDFSGVGTYIANEQRTCLSPTARSIEAGFIREPLPTVAADDSSITGHVYQTGKTRRFDDIRTSEYLQSNATEMRAGMFAPMGEHGVLIIGSRAVGEFGPQEQRLVELLAANARAAYDRVERDQRLQRRIEQQKVVTELGAQGLAKRSIDTLLAAASRQVSETLDTDYCKVLDLDDSGAELTLRQGVGWDDGIVGSATVSATEDDSQAAYTLRTSEPVVVSALETETRFSGPDLLTDHDVQSGISTTIGPPGDPWGILGTHDTASRDFTQHDVNFVQSVANVLGSAIVRHEDEQALLQQREQLAALNNLNEVVREITDAVIEQSTREEIESTVCERLADSDSYLFAWIGDVDAATNTVQLRTEAGVENYLEDIVISVDPDDERSEGATGRAFRSGEIRTTQDITVDERYEPWRDQIEEHSFRSSAAIPIVHDGTTYGMLNVYAERPYAFEGEERAVISQLGEIIGHAIAATERKQSLLGDELVALEFYVPSLYDSVDVDEPPTGRIEFEHVVPLSEDEFIVYGQVADDAVAYLEALAEALPHWGLVTVNSSDGDPRFELQLSTPPVLSEIASVGGVIDHAVIEDGDYHMAVHVSTTVDTRQIIDTVEEAYPAAQLLKHRQVSRETRSDSLDEIVTADLTDRQRTALRVAHRAGFFEWPRDVSGEDVAETLEITPPTFHQHLRNAERKIFEQLLSASTVEI
jgi:PAS domain S-box-containing protein